MAVQAFHCKDGSVRVFNDAENHARTPQGPVGLLPPMA